MIRLSFSLLLIAVISQSFYGQTTTVSEQEIRPRKLKAEEILRTVPSVQIVTEETVDQASGKFSRVAMRTRELAPPHRERIIAEVVQKDGTNKKFYSVKIGEISYIKSQEGEWQQVDGREYSGPIAGMQISAAYEFLGKEIVAGIPVEVFKIKSSYAYGTAASYPRGGNETTYYFDKTGHLRKTLIVTFNSEGVNRRISTLYSYPKSILIEAPIRP